MFLVKLESFLNNEVLLYYREDVYTMHYLMFAVVMVKALSNLFNAVSTCTLTETLKTGII